MSPHLPAGLLVAGCVAGLASAVCDMIIVAHAFRASTVKGLLCLLVPIYGLYYALVRFEHPEKLTVVLGAFGGGAIAEMCLERVAAHLTLMP